MCCQNSPEPSHILGVLKKSKYFLLSVYSWRVYSLFDLDRRALSRQKINKVMKVQAIGPLAVSSALTDGKKIMRRRAWYTHFSPYCQFLHRKRVAPVMLMLSWAQKDSQIILGWDHVWRGKEPGIWLNRLNVLTVEGAATSVSANTNAAKSQRKWQQSAPIAAASRHTS